MYFYLFHLYFHDKLLILLQTLINLSKGTHSFPLHICILFIYFALKFTVSVPAQS